jgi:hypothetical protein
MMGDDSVFWLLAAMVVLGVSTLVLVLRWHWEWKRPTPAMTQAEATQHVAYLMSERIGCAMRAGEIDQEIVDRWEDWPAAYRPALWQIVRQAQLLEETHLHEAYERGIVPKRTYTQGPFIAPPPDRPHPVLEETAPVEVASTPTPTNVVAIGRAPRATWINGQLVRTA